MTAKTTLKSITLVSISLLLTVLPAVIHGRFTNRWGPSASTEDAVQQLRLVPEQFGPWRMASETNELPNRVIRELGLFGYWSRNYVHQVSGDEVTVLLMAGLPGALSRHPPEICYASRANERIGAPAQVEVVDTEQTSHEFRLLRFKASRGLGSRFTVCYGFTVDGTWSSPKYPRIQFGGESLLYKMQVLSELENQEEDLPLVTSQFLREFLPAFRETCVAGKQSRQPSAELMKTERPTRNMVMTYYNS